MAIYISDRNCLEDYNFTRNNDNRSLFCKRNYLGLKSDLRNIMTFEYVSNKDKEITLRKVLQGGLLIDGTIYNSMYDAFYGLRLPYLLNNYKELDLINLRKIIKARIVQDIDYWRILKMFYETSFSKISFFYLEHKTQNVPLSSKGKLLIYICKVNYTNIFYIVNSYLGCCIYKLHSYGDNIYGECLNLPEIKEFCLKHKPVFDPYKLAKKKINDSIVYLNRCDLDNAYDVIKQASKFYEKAAKMTNDKICKFYFTEKAEFYNP